MTALPVEPVEVEAESLAEVRALVPRQAEPGVDPRILKAMTAEAERQARLDPVFTERTRERLRVLLGAR